MNMYYADVIGQEWNCLYPHQQEITDDASLAKAVSRDYVCAEYKGGYPVYAGRAAVCITPQILL